MTILPKEAHPVIITIIPWETGAEIYSQYVETKEASLDKRFIAIEQLQLINDIHDFFQYILTIIIWCSYFFLFMKQFDMVVRYHVIFSFLVISNHFLWNLYSHHQVWFLMPFFIPRHNESHFSVGNTSRYNLKGEMLHTMV